MDTRWKHPFATLISDPSGAGKTEFVRKFLQNLEFMSNAKFSKIILFYGEWQPTYAGLPGKIEFKEGVPRSADFAADDSAGPQLAIIDEAGKSVAQIFTKISHHRDLSVFFLTQNLFHRGQREILFNSNYVVVFKNPRACAQMRHFSHQICPENPRFVQEVYADATARPYGYLLFDLKQETPDNCRLRTDILSHDRNIIYVPSSSGKSIKSTIHDSDVPVLRM